jgi:hypothetical protein
VLPDLRRQTYQMLILGIVLGVAALAGLAWLLVKDMGYTCVRWATRIETESLGGPVAVCVEPRRR